jgi:hypothetical protein
MRYVLFVYDRPDCASAREYTPTPMCASEHA